MEEDDNSREYIRKKVLYDVGEVGEEHVYFGEHLLFDGYEGMEEQMALVRKGLDLFKEPRDWDNERCKVRMFGEAGKMVFVIYNTSGERNGYYFMKKEDMPWIEETWH